MYSSTPSWNCASPIRPPASCTGVRETIARGSNLFVTYPGYSDYRHIPVIGKGVTFQLPAPGSLGHDVRGRSGRGLSPAFAERYEDMPAHRNHTVRHGQPVAGVQRAVETALYCSTACCSCSAPGRSPHSGRAGWRYMRGDDRGDPHLAEGEGNLRQRVDSSAMPRDESGDMARWINNFIDSWMAWSVR